MTEPRAALLFDLDGTLTDPFVGITSSIRYAMEKLGRIAPAAEDLRWCIGPPLVEIFPLLLASDDPGLSSEAVRHYRVRYADVGKFENTLIEGIPEALEKLSEQGHFLTVATSKLKTYAGEIVDHFGLRRFFPVVHGSELDGRNAAKADLIRHILAVEPVDPARTLMIGDRSHDVVGAAANGLSCVGVLWGFGDEAELDGAGASAIAGRPDQLPETVARLMPAAIAP